MEGTKQCTPECNSNLIELSGHKLHCGVCDSHLTSLLLCPKCGKRYGDTVYAVTYKLDRKTVWAGLVRCRDGVVYMTAPCWNVFVGKTEDDVLQLCQERGYQVEGMQ